MMKKAIDLVTKGVECVFIAGAVTGFVGCVALLSYAAGDSKLLEKIAINKKSEEQNEPEEDSEKTEE